GSAARYTRLRSLALPVRNRRLPAGLSLEAGWLRPARTTFRLEDRGPSRYGDGAAGRGRIDRRAQRSANERDFRKSLCPRDLYDWRDHAGRTTVVETPVPVGAPAGGGHARGASERNVASISV